MVKNFNRASDLESRHINVLIPECAILLSAMKIRFPANYGPYKN
jgi:hypothetical protein